MSDPKPYCVVVNSPTRCWFKTEFEAAEHAIRLRRGMSYGHSGYLVARRTDDVIDPTQAIVIDREITERRTRIAALSTEFNEAHCSYHNHNEEQMNLANAKTTPCATKQRPIDTPNPYDNGTPAWVMFPALRNAAQEELDCKRALDDAKARYEKVKERANDHRTAIRKVTGKKAPV